MKLAQALGVSLDALTSYEPADNMGLPVPPKGKHFFGVVTVGEKGQIVIPARARKLFSIEAGDLLVILGDEGQGLALMKTDGFLQMAEAVRREAHMQQD